MAANKELSLDILTEILVRLPVKTLCRLRCVRKPWSSLISSPFFQQAHLHHSQKDPLFFTAQNKLDSINGTRYLHLCTYNKEGTLLTNLSIPVHLKSILRIYSCQGLVCFGSVGTIHVFNPTSQDLIALPLPPRPTIKDGVNYYGFGYANSTKEFKLVRFFNPNNEVPQLNGSFCNVLTLGTNDWKVAKRSPYPVFQGAPFLQGALHLQPIHEFFVDYIAAFDIESEEYRKIRLPESVTRLLSTLRRGMSLKELGGLLCLYFGDINKKELQLWILKDYINVEWVTYTIDLSLISPRVFCASPLAIMGDVCMLLSVYLKDERMVTKFLFWYDTEDKILPQKIAGTGFAVNVRNANRRSGITLSHFNPHRFGKMTLYAESFSGLLASRILLQKQREDIMESEDASKLDMVVV